MSKTLFIEVTNTLSAKSVSGIQRVSIELIRQLINTEYQLELITYCHSCRQYRSITKNEFQALLFGKGNRYDRFLNRLLHYVGFKKCLGNLFRESPGSLFLDLEAAWHNPCERSQLLPQLIANKVTPILIQYDLIPILFPEYIPDATTVKFTKFLHAHINHTKHVLCISESTKHDLDAFLLKNKLQDIQTASFQLGSNFSKRLINASSIKHKYFILAVGTLEVRKNRDRLIRVFDKIKHHFPELELVLVGKPGWKADKTIQTIRHHPDLNERIFWYDRLKDDELSSLYQQAALVIEPSLYEGFGLPVAEALSYGCIVLSSNRGALPEAGRNYSIYFDPENEDQLYDQIFRCLSDSSYFAKQKEFVKQYKPVTWKESASQLIRFLGNISNEN